MKRQRRSIEPAIAHLGAFASEVRVKWARKTRLSATLSERDLTWLAEIAFRPVDLNEIELVTNVRGGQSPRPGKHVSLSRAKRFAQMYADAPDEVLEFLAFARKERMRKLGSKEWIARTAARWWSYVAHMQGQASVDGESAQKDLERRLKNQGFSEREIGNSKALLYRALSQVRATTTGPRNSNRKVRA